jgi:hypothetical protein
LGLLQIGSGMDEYIFDVMIWQTFITSEPSAILGIQRPYNKLSFHFGVPYGFNSNDTKNLVNFFLTKYKYTDDNSVEKFIDSSFQIGNLTLNHHQLSLDTTLAPEENFEISMWFGNCRGGIGWVTGSSSSPEQKGTLECTSFTKNYEPDSIHYQMKLKFDNLSLKLVDNLLLEKGEIGYDFKIPR